MYLKNFQSWTFIIKIVKVSKTWSTGRKIIGLKYLIFKSEIQNSLNVAGFFFFFLIPHWQNYLTWSDTRLFIVFVIPLNWIFICFLAEMLMYLITSCCPDLIGDTILYKTSIISIKSGKLWCSRLISPQGFFEVCMHVCMYVYTHAYCVHRTFWKGAFKLRAVILSYRMD